MKNFEKLSQKEKDILRISKILNISSEIAKEIWQEYSATFYAQWECLPYTNKELKNILEKYLYEYLYDKKVNGRRKKR